MNKKTLLAALLAASASPLALAQELPPGFGVDTPNKSKFTSTIRVPSDVDDYVFDGFTGQKVVALVKASKKSTLSPSIQLIRPDGSVVTEGDGLKRNVKSNKGKLVFTTDQTGVWKVRVGSQDPSVGDNPEYTVIVKYGKPKPSKVKDPAAGGGSYTFDVPAVGGARVDFKFAFKSGDPTFGSFSDPDGDEIALFDNQLVLKKKAIQGKKIELAPNLPLGDYEVVIDEGDTPATKVKWQAKVKLPKGAKKRKEVLDGNEPVITQMFPTVGGPSTVITFEALNAIDEADAEDEDALPSIEIGGAKVTELERISANQFNATVPFDVPEGVSDVILRSSRGQVAVIEDGFERVGPPVIAATDFISPASGPNVGGFEVTIRGQFRKVGDTQIVIGINSTTPVPVTVVSESLNHITFIAPARSPGLYTFGIRDRVTQLIDRLPNNSFEYLFSPVINQINPPLTTVLGGDSLFVTGVQFEDSDTLFMERADGGFDEILEETFVNSQLHQLTAPVRPRGEYEIFLRDSDGVRSPGRRTITYFEFVDGTDLLNEPGADLRDGYTTAYGDFDRDGDDDVFIAFRGTGAAQNSSQLRVFENDGTGGLTDVTSQVMPTPTATDDWRADRVFVDDVTDDDWPDIVITTNSQSVPADNKSHTRILQSKRRSGGEVDDREFEDQTATLMAPVRMRTPFSFGSGTPVVGDNWRGLDMFVGDLDNAPNGRREIVVTHDEVKSEYKVSCEPYCQLPNGNTAEYSFYWGGTRLFFWDQTKRDGAGQFKFDPNGLPSRRAVTVPQPIPGGGTSDSCNNSNPCVGEFTPFTGQRLRVGELNGDSKPDIAVLNKNVVRVSGRDASSLQVAINKFDPAGITVTDVTKQMPSTGSDTTGDSLTIGQSGFPDGNSFGTIAVSRSATAGPDSVLRIIQLSPSAVGTNIVDATDVSDDVLPATTATDKFQADWMQFVDVDSDGDQDLLLLSGAEVAAEESSLRILRNVAQNGQIGIFTRTLQQLFDDVATEDEIFDGTTFLLGDINQDDLLDILITRSESTDEGTQTRLVRAIK